MGLGKQINFKKVPFTMNLPQLETNPGFVRILTNFTFKHSEEDLILKKIIIKNKQYEISEDTDDYYLKQIQASYLLDVKFSRKEKFPLSNSFLIFIFFSNKRRVYQVEYKIDRQKKCQLNNVDSRDATLAESKSFVDTVRINKKSLKSTDLSLELFRRKLFRELYYLKENGGKKYKVTNGRFINVVENMYCYDFELESELTIEEDSPVLFHLSFDKVKGYVFNCDGFHISLLLEKFIGDIINSGFISAEPWKLLEALSNRIESISEEDKLAYDIVNKHYKIVEEKSADDIPKGQEIAVERALKSPITIIWGPPGTGKTYTMVQIAMRLLEAGETLMMVSHSNVSVDGMILELYDQIEKKGSEKLKHYVRTGKILRYGYVRNEKLVDNKYVVSFNYALHQNKKLFNRREFLLEEKRNKEKNPNKRIDIDVEEELKNIKLKVKEEEKAYINYARLIATTISKTSIDPFFKDKKFNTVMFDEVSMAYVPHVFSAARFASQRFVCVGDFRQLAPIAQSDARDILSLDIFKYLNVIDSSGRLNYHPWLVMLNCQRRMHPSISAFPRKRFYDDLLIDYEKIESQRNNIVNKDPFLGHATVLIDISNTYCLANKNSDNSRYNILSACVSFMIALLAVNSGQGSVGIITPYRAQSRLIQGLIYDCGLKNNIVCSTVHQFQGSECDVIIFDAVESYPMRKPGILMSKNDNESLARLVNVAISRARGKLIVVANVEYWIHKCKDSKNNIFYTLIKDYKQNVLNINKNLVKTISNNNLQHRNIRLLTEELYLTALLRDIKKSKQKIIVSISDSSLGDEQEKAILQELKNVRSRGVDVAIKAEDYKSLPSYWKGSCWSTDETVFPLILIDDRILWYGAPVTKGAMKDSDRTVFSNQKMFFRSTGKKFIEQVKSMTDLESKINDGIKQTLTQKDSNSQQIIKNNEEKKSKTYSGLSAYIFRNIRCPKCGKPMKLAKNARGVFYLKCSSCKDVEYLTSEIVNTYIEENNIKCPEHNCNIVAKLGQYGLYIRCEMNHYLKISDI